MSAHQHKASARGDRGGYVLIVLLIVATVGILFGLGRLLAFRYQCEQRMDRNRELEKVLATRSVITYLAKTNISNVRGTSVFTYVSSANASAYFLTNTLAPAKFSVDFRGASYSNELVFYPAGSDLLYSQPDSLVGLRIGTSDPARMDEQAGVYVATTNNWLDPQEVYGLRYVMNVSGLNYDSTLQTGDVLRLIIQPVANTNVNLVLEQIPVSDISSKLVASIWSNSVLCFTCESGEEEPQKVTSKGVQLVGGKLTLFDWEERGVVFVSESVDMPEWVVDEFRGVLYLAVECQVGVPIPINQNPSSFGWIEVRPAYTYEIALGWYSGKDRSNRCELATVAHASKISLSRSSIVTYETHGTAAK